MSGLWDSGKQGMFSSLLRIKEPLNVEHVDGWADPYLPPLPIIISTLL
jgi:hypothetical protein